MKKNSKTTNTANDNRILGRKVAKELSKQDLAAVAGGLAPGETGSGPCCCADDCAA